MNTALLMQYGIPAVVGVLSAVVGHWHGKRTAASAPAAKSGPATPALPFPGNLSGLVSDPIVQLVLAKLVTAAHASGHAALDAAVVKLMPGLSPLVPTINQVVDSVESSLVK